jgi:hypothetical protein
MLGNMDINSMITIAGGIISFQPPGIVNGKFRVEFKTWSWVFGC